MPLGEAMAEQIWAWSEEAAEALGLYVWELDMSAQPRWKIRLFVDRPGEIGPGHGVTVDECARVSRYLEALLDAEESVPQDYMLEVSSPGIERVIDRPEQLERVVGRTVQLHPEHPEPGVPNPIVGVLREVEGLGADSVLVVRLARGARRASGGLAGTGQGAAPVRLWRRLTSTALAGRAAIRGEESVVR